MLLFQAACPGDEEPPARVDSGVSDLDGGLLGIDAALPPIDADPADTGDAGAAPGDRLPETAFIFERQVRRVDGYVSHVYSFDRASGQERLIKAHNRRLEGLALSLDRRTIAWTELAYQTSALDSRLSYLYGMVWLMGVDGQGARALTGPPPVPLNETGPTCALTLTCPGIASCIAGRCAYEYFKHEYKDLVFAPDGKSLFAGVYMSWFSLDPLNSGGGNTVSFPLEGGARGIHGLRGCLLKTPVAFHPDGQTAVIGHHGCAETPEGFHEFGVNPFAPRGLLVAPPALSEWSSTQSLVWWPDGSALLFVAKSVRKQDPRQRRAGLYMWERATGQYQRLFEPATDDLDIADVTITRQGEIIVATEVRNGDGWLGFLEVLDPATSQLTRLPVASPVLRPRG